LIEPRTDIKKFLDQKANHYDEVFEATKDWLQILIGEYEIVLEKYDQKRTSDENKIFGVIDIFKKFINSGNNGKWRFLNISVCDVKKECIINISRKHIKSGDIEYSSHNLVIYLMRKFF
jgi:hypothetical protein